MAYQLLLAGYITGCTALVSFFNVAPNISPGEPFGLNFQQNKWEGERGGNEEEKEKGVCDEAPELGGKLSMAFFFFFKRRVGGGY